jgi:4-hydroxybenzoate polyprenyltransferase
MQRAMEKLRLYAQSVPITFESWILSFAGIVLIRIFLEQFSSFLPGRFPVIDLPTILHYSAFYLASILIMMSILLLFAKTSMEEISVICLFAFSIIWIPPIIDILAAGVGGHTMSYLFVPGKELMLRFVTFFGGHIDSGVTLGIQIEVILGIIFSYAYVYAVTKNIARAIGAAFALYFFLFFLGSMPSLITLFLPEQMSSSAYLLKSMTSSHVIQNSIHPSFSATDTGLIDLAFNKIMLGINIIVAMIAGMFLFFKGAQKKFIAMMKNSRPERIFYFFLLFIFGTTLAHTLPTNWIDAQSYILAILALFSAAMFSICQNDIHDEKIDAISNTGRALISKDLSRSDMEMASKIFLLFAILSAYASSHYVLFFTCLMIFIYFIYSNPPLRLKRFVLVNSGLISLAAVSAVLAGFFLVNPGKSILAFPFELVVAIVIFHTATSSYRDIKDFEGDRAAGIKTLPVLLGLERSKKLIAGIICFFFLLIPWYFHIPSLLIPSLIVAALSWYVINEKNYRGWKSSAVHTAYLILIIIAVAFQ